MNGYLEKAWYGLPLLLLGWFEVRVRGKVGKDRFNDLKIQTDRVESHLWDLMKAQKIKPSMDVPDSIKNNGN